MKTFRSFLLVLAGLVLGPMLSAQPFTTLYPFSGGADGGYPSAGLVLAGNTLYGTAFYDAVAGGGSGGGTVFALNVAGTGFAPLHDFSGPDGSGPEANLTWSGGVLYGTTYRGGTAGNGTVFSVNTNGGNFQVLHSFSTFSAPTGPANVNPDGGWPYCSLVLAGNTLYGTAWTGGSAGQGTVFAVNTDGSGFATLYNFSGGGDGGNPNAGLAVIGGTLYGTTFQGGGSGYGTVFAINTNGGGFQTLYSFTGGGDGNDTLATLAVSGGTLYGTTVYGGSAETYQGDGTIFSINADGSDFQTLYTFPSLEVDSGVNRGGAYPDGGVTVWGGKLYGTTYGGGVAGVGTVYSINTNGTDFESLYNFSGGADGGNPYEGNLLVANNTVFGTTSEDGAAGYGTVFGLPLAAAPPSLLTLANLCNNIYLGNAGYGDFQFAGNNITLLPGTTVDAGFQAAAYVNSAQAVVIAFRGTVIDFENDVATAESLKSLAADVSFGGGTPNELLQDDVADAVDFVQLIGQKYPGATLYLTGHSLGGAIAQLVGEASHLSTVAFNAPGAQNLYASLAGELQVGTWGNADSTNGNTNYRINGDQVSLFGDPTGASITLAAPAYLTFAETVTPANAGSVLMSQINDLLQLHFITTVIAQLADNAPQVSGATGPNLAGVIQDAIQPASGSTVLPAIYNFLFDVSGSDQLIDPSSGTDFIFSGQPGSPNFSSLDLPAFSQVSWYDTRYEAGGTWSNFELLPPGVPEIFGAGVTNVEFVPVDANGDAVTESNFLFAADFATPGTFTGTLTESTAIPPLVPVLQIALAATQVNLSWNTNVLAGFAVVSTANLNPPVTWLPVTNAPAIIGNKNVITLPVSAATRFFTFRATP